MRTAVPRVAAIHDLSGFGRTSLAVVIPILSAMGVQVCAMPTAVLSTHTTEFKDFSFLDLSGEMRRFLEHWTSLGLQFDAVYSGFLGCAAQMAIVAECIERCLLPGGLAVIDPVMGDNGKLDPTITLEMVEQMRWLISRAHCITPNYSEACWLLNKPYAPESSTECIRDWLVQLAEMGPEIVVVTSAPVASRPQDSSVVGYHRGQRRFWKVDCAYIPAFYPGTGDIFTSVLTGSLLQGDSLPLAMDRAVYFVTQGIRATFGHTEPNHYGILLERVLETLRSPAALAGYELMADEA
ncbi:MAG: pyridoxamine kinase [Deltaproteobacteria bacterium]|jgi:pyridoxine kinase|nr:pyridoxamine kinase [Deltaproteobacteria bacterium]